jgi:hypothetical protein
MKQMSRLGPSLACGQGRGLRSRRQLIEDDWERRGAHAGLVGRSVVPLQRVRRRALCHHPSHGRHHSLPSVAREASEFSNSGRFTTKMRRFSTMSRMDVARLQPEDVARPNRQAGSEIELREAMLLPGVRRPSPAAMVGISEGVGRCSAFASLYACPTDQALIPQRPPLVVRAVAPDWDNLAYDPRFDRDFGGPAGQNPYPLAGY